MKKTGKTWLFSLSYVAPKNNYTKVGASHTRLHWKQNWSNLHHHKQPQNMLQLEDEIMRV